MPASWVDIDVNGQTMEGYLAQPEGEGSRPAVVVIQEIWGVNSHIQSVTDKLRPRICGACTSHVPPSRPDDHGPPRGNGHRRRQHVQVQRR